VSHLGEHLSALVDGELSGAELDRAHAHLAGCEQCRAEAAMLRELKRQLRGLGAAGAGDALTRRLLTMAGPGGPVPSRCRAERPGRALRGPHGDSHGPRRRYLMWGAVPLVVVGVGAVAFSMGGGAVPPPGPKVNPQVEMFSVEHAITSGDVPLPEPAQAPAPTPTP
jgi:anti-sigma factor RsiW